MAKAIDGDQETVETEKASENKHPLMVREIGRIDSYQDWKLSLAEATTSGQFLELFHSAFGLSLKCSFEERQEQICTLLTFADGYREFENFVTPEERDARRGARFAPYNPKALSQPERRFEVVQKAMHVLVDNFFQDVVDHEKTSMPSWAGLVCQPAVLEKLLWFFDPTRRTDIFTRNNLPRGITKYVPAPVARQDQILIDFLQKLVKFGWVTPQFSDCSDEKNASYQANFVRVRPQLIEIAERIGFLMFLTTSLFSLDDPSKVQLREISLRKKHYGDGPFESLEEALVVGKRAAALVLLLCPIVEAEQRRQIDLKAVEMLERDLENRRRALTSAAPARK